MLGVELAVSRYQPASSGPPARGREGSGILGKYSMITIATNAISSIHLVGVRARARARARC